MLSLLASGNLSVQFSILFNFREDFQLYTSGKKMQVFSQYLLRNLAFPEGFPEMLNTDQCPPQCLVQILGCPRLAQKPVVLSGPVS